MLIGIEHTARHHEADPGVLMPKRRDGVRKEDRGELHLSKELLLVRNDLILRKCSFLHFILVVRVSDEPIRQPWRVTDDEMKSLPEHCGPVGIADDESPNRVLLLDD